jgi:hypothetical protein
MELAIVPLPGTGLKAAALAARFAAPDLDLGPRQRFLLGMPSTDQIGDVSLVRT